MKHTLLLIFVALLLSINCNAQCTITGTTVNASTLTCSSLSGCTIVYVGNGSSATTLTMNADLNLSCLGAIQFIVRNNASIDFSPGNNRLTLGSGSSLTIASGASLIGGSCNASERIYIGTNLLASCNGGAGADVSFDTITSMGGTGSLSSNSPVCANNNLTLSATPPPNGTYTYSFFGSGLSATGTTYSSSSTYSLTAPSTAGSYTYQVKMQSSLSGNPTTVAEVTVVVNSGSVSTPVITVTQPNCSVNTGTITVTSPTGTGITYSTNGTTYTNTTGIFASMGQGTYSITAKNTSGCISSATSAIVTSQTNTWNGTSWSNGSAPTGAQKIVFSGDYSSTSSLTGCSCQVTANVVINSGHTLTINDEIKVTGGGAITFEAGAGLVQTNDAAVNTGNIVYKRKTTALKQYDYTYWSSPVASATLSQLATNSLFYSFNPSTGYWANQSGATAMTPGVGYIGRAPTGLTYSPTQIVTTNFTGVPNNGVISAPIIKSAASAYNLIGNPYPSAIDADLFIAANASVTNGTIYFWTHGTAITNNVYTINDYAKYNYTGGVGTSIPAPSGGTSPSGKIAAGQGFFIEAKTSLSNGTHSATFNDAMRIAGNNTQFFKNSTPGNATNTISQGLERHRVWLSLRSTQGAYNQTLVGYVQGATNDFDPLFDGKTLAGGNSVSIYTMVGADYLAIQGKSLPFSESDIIPLGYGTTLNGELSINLDNLDGLFTDQNVYLLDKVTNTLHDLKVAPYPFTTTSGNFENRFELRFTNQALGTNIPTITDNDIKIITGNHQLEVISPAMAIAKVEVFDILGKLLFSQKDLNTNLYQTNSLQLAPQVLLVKVTLDNEQNFTKKTLFQ